MREFGKIALGGALAALCWAAASEEGSAMGAAPAPILVACATEGAKTTLPEGLCAQFAAELAAAYPDRGAALADAGQTPAVRLVVLSASPRSLTARMDWGSQPGQSLGTALSGGSLSPQHIARFLGDLIAANPAP